ncbi:MAG: exodeoxyribonuclease III [Gammaproteobacteria bacterium]
MKCISFNTNGIRARPHQLQMLMDKHRPDIVGIQETKAQDADFPLEMVNNLGLHAEFFGQKAHYGVALLSQHPATTVQKGFPGDDDESQKRLISATYALPSGKSVTVINGYFPQGESREHETKFPAKMKFYADLLDYLQKHHKPTDDLIVMGDMNIAPTDIDLGIGPDSIKRWLKNGKCSFLPEERDWLQSLMDWGLIDTWRIHHPETHDQFSWFDYRSRAFERDPKRGLRIDLILATASLAERCTDSGICYDIRSMEKPSDHCPIWSSFAI